MWVGGAELLARDVLTRQTVQAVASRPSSTHAKISGMRVQLNCYGYTFYFHDSDHDIILLLCSGADPGFEEGGSTKIGARAKF